MVVIYIAGFRQHAGKTLTSLGVIAELSKYMNTRDIGYIKPVGQQSVKLEDGRQVDKDIKIIENFVLPGIDMRYVFPVMLGSGVTKEYLKSSDRAGMTVRFERSIEEALVGLRDKKVVIAEGTGHPGVGGVVNLSNSRVAQLMNAEILYLAGGGIGKTLDMLEVDLSYFRCSGAKVRGIVFNKLIPEKIGQMKEYITEELLTEHYSPDGKPIRILGYFPTVTRLNKPSMELIYRHFPNAIVAGDISLPEWKIPSAGVTIISQSHENFRPEEHLKPGDVVILSAYSQRRLQKVLDFNASLPDEDKIAGIIFTCAKVGRLLKDSIKSVVEHRVPGLYVFEDSSYADEKLYNCIKNTKLQVYDREKSEQIKALFAEHFDTERFMETFGIELT